MGKFKDTLMDILSCDFCYGQGWQLTGNAIDYDVWACSCNTYNVPADEIMEYHILFKTKENA